MPRGVGLNWLYDEARLQNRLLTPRALAVRMQSRLNFWYSADWLSVDASRLVSGAADLTGNGNNGVQATAANRLTYFASDQMFGGRPSFGSTTVAGARRLDAPANLLYRHQFFSAYYKDGTSTIFDANTMFSAGTASFSAPRIMGNINSSDLVNNSVYATAASIGGRAASATVLPLPASVIRADGNSTFSLQIGGSSVTTVRVLVGGFRHFVGCNQVLSNLEIALIEGVIAWDDGTPLVASHPFANRPPLIGD